MSHLVGSLKATIALALTVFWIGAAVADEVTIPAKQLSDRSANISAEYPQFANLTLCMGRGGFMEWAF
ncbi:MAG: hypothetical protein ACYSWQ_10390, partial [Planctomycetota bacterium]